SPLTLFSVIFSLPFEGVTFSKGIVRNSILGFSKDAGYDFLKNPRYNWRKFMLALATSCFDILTSEEREQVLIFDDSTYDRSRSKAVALLAWIYGHNVGRSLKGFKLLTLGWSDGNSFLPLDFVLYSSTNAEKRLQGISKKMDKRCCGYKR
ncbi:MAG TPA: IS4 family transposase, partial [Desulfocapsa sulfexigens]|nr:IS4 family transposase [Desulfocapsa sulfexigens]